jgi:hypothetical protein
MKRVSKSKKYGKTRGFLQDAVDQENADFHALEKST